MRTILLIGALGAFLFAWPISSRSRPLPGPRNVVVDIVRDRYTISWNPVLGASEYRVYVDDLESSDDSVKEVRATGLVKAAGIHEFAVAAVDSNGAAGRRSRTFKGIRFSRPWGIALMKDGRRIVRDAHFAKQAVLDFAGRALELEGPDGITLAGSYDVAVDRSGRILTARWGDGMQSNFGFVVQNRRFKVTYEHNQPAGDGPGEFRQPMGIGADSEGNIFVADTGNNRVQQFTRDGKFTRIIGEGELRLPMKVAFDQQDRLYVADSGNNRIAIYEKAASGDHKLASSIIGMKEPVYVAIDKARNVFVSANRQAGVHMFGPDGKELWKYEGDTIAHLSGPRGLALDGKGNLIIVDEASLRVLTVKIPPVKRAAAQARIL